MKQCRGSIREIGDAKIIDCLECGYKHVYPLPSPEELNSFYTDDFYTTEKPVNIQRYLEDEEWWELTYVSRLSHLESIGLPEKSVLDVGSGPGLFLKFAVKNGWKALGVEPSKVAVEHTLSLGCEVVEGFLDLNLSKKIGSFSAIHASEVLEHVPDPKEMLNIFYSLLEPGGLVCICVPNDFNIFQEALVSEQKYKEWWVDKRHHLNYFNHGSLIRLLESSSFKIEKVTSSFPIDLFLMMGDNYIGNDNLGRQCHKRRMNFELLMKKSGNDDSMGRMYEYFAQLGLGREILVYARKK
jgi:2-polyprenyl-3-methyl-5-hydroxy-6-metoxy-1,4-benzoquinol methylase